MFALTTSDQVDGFDVLAVSRGLAELLLRDLASVTDDLVRHSAGAGRSGPGGFHH